ncbi:hypothetical protein ACIBCH_17215 [Amycolatopsis thailandensis]|uniref:hypothetical protein n=1 Tax=Amycolatopsis thailandensis TaxID=589330 RepID=UPI00378E7FDD
MNGLERVVWLNLDSALIEAYGDRLYGAGMARFDHGLLVVAAPDSRDDHASWAPAVENVHGGPDSVFLAVRQSASGPVGVVCVEAPADFGQLELLYEGEIYLEKASLAIHDPNGQLSLQMPVDGKRNEIKIYGDHPDESAEVMVVLRSLPD